MLLEHAVALDSSCGSPAKFNMFHVLPTSNNLEEESLGTEEGLI